jgi:hypothetical protein
MPNNMWISEDEKDTQFGKCWQGICLTQISKAYLNRYEANKVRSIFNKYSELTKELTSNIKDNKKLDRLLGLIIPTIKERVQELDLTCDDPQDIKDRLFDCLKRQIHKQRMGQ